MKKRIIVLFCVLVIIAGWRSMSSSEESNEVEQTQMIENIVTVDYPIYYAFEDKISVSGTITPIEEVLISSAISGKIQETLAEVGEDVQSGQLLVRLEGEMYQLLLEQSENDVELALLAYDSAKADYERYKVLHDSGSVSKVNFDNMDKTYKMAKINYESSQTQCSIAAKNLKDTLIKSKINGVVAEKYITTGENVFPGTQLFKVVDNHNVFIMVKLNEKKIDKITEDTQVQVELSNSEPVIGIVESISPMPIEGELNYEVKIRVDNAQKKLKLGGFAMVSIISEKSDGHLAIKTKWMHQDDDRHYVWMNKNNRAEKSYVEIGLEIEDMTEIINGIEETDQIIVTSNNSLNEGDLIKLSN